MGKGPTNSPGRGPWNWRGEMVSFNGRGIPLTEKEGVTVLEITRRGGGGPYPKKKPNEEEKRAVFLRQCI